MIIKNVKIVDTDRIFDGSAEVLGGKITRVFDGFSPVADGEVIDGEHVVAKGKVEKVIVNGEHSHYRIVVGTTREAIDEYLKLKESPA
jgi:predicted nucleotidyltransferase